MEATKGHGEDAGQARLKGTMEEEDGGAQIAHEREMSSTDQSHTKLRSSTHVGEEGDPAGDQQGVGSLYGQPNQRMEQSQMSPPPEPINNLAPAEPMATENSRQGRRRGTQTRRHVIKEGLEYKLRKMGMTH